MPEYLHPGVYIQEESSGAKPIAGASTSTAAIVGTSSRGRPSYPTFVTDFSGFERAFGGLDKNHHMPLGVYHFFLNGGRRAYIVRVLPSDATTAYVFAQLGDTTTTIVDQTYPARSTDADADPDAIPPSEVVEGDTVTTGHLTIAAAGKGDWGNEIDVTIRLNTLGRLPESDVADEDEAIQEENREKPWLFDFFIEYAGNVVESFTSVGIKEDGDRFYASVINRDSSYIRVLPDAEGNYPETTFATPHPDGDDDIYEQICHLGDNENNNENNEGSDSVEGLSPTATDYGSALTSLDRIDDFSLLLLPGVTSGPNVADIGLQGINYAEGRRPFQDIFYIMDPPGTARDSRSADQMIQDVKDFLNKKITPKSTYAALYFPWIEIADPYSKLQGATRLAPPSGAIAGLMARTDNTRGVWKAPAGTEAGILGAVRLPVNVTDSEQDALNPIGVNCIRQFPASGIVCWGARTLSTNSNPEWRYVPIRRTALFLEKSLYRGTQWVVFEPNDEPLWSNIRFNINAFMTTLFRAGAFQGGKPDEAYLVKCDKENNIQATIDNGEVHILVAFAPLKPAEFVIIHIQQLRKQ